MKRVMWEYWGKLTLDYCYRCVKFYQWCYYSIEYKNWLKVASNVKKHYFPPFLGKVVVPLKLYQLTCQSHPIHVFIVLGSSTPCGFSITWRLTSVREVAHPLYSSTPLHQYGLLSSWTNLGFASYQCTLFLQSFVSKVLHSENWSK